MLFSLLEGGVVDLLLYGDLCDLYLLLLLEVVVEVVVVVAVLLLYSDLFDL